MADYSDIHKKLTKADALLERDSYQEAYTLYHEVTTELMELLEQSSTTRKIAKGAGWAAALLTGGFGPEDFIIVPLVNKFLMKFLGLDLGQTLQMLYIASTRKLFIIGLDRSISASVPTEKVLLDFLIAYRIVGESADKKMLDSLMTLINPFAEDSSLNGSENRYSQNDLLGILHPETLRNHPQIAYLNGFLLLYLTDKNLTGNTIYTSLRERQSQFYSSYREYYRNTASPNEEAEKAKYYGELFGLQGKVTKEEIRKRYRELMKTYHPDKLTGADEARIREAEEKVKKINEAYEYFKKKYGL